MQVNISSNKEGIHYLIVADNLFVNKDVRDSFRHWFDNGFLDEQQRAFPLANLLGDICHEGFLGTENY